MSVAEGMKDAVAGIRTAGKERHSFVADVRRDTKELLHRFDRELTEMAADLRKFLATSERTRMEDFRAIMRGIEQRLQALRKETGTVLAEGRSWVKECHADQAAARRTWQEFAKKGSAGE